MAGTKSPRVKDGMTKKRKRDTNDSDGQPKRHRQQGHQNKANGGDGSVTQKAKNAESGTADSQPLTTSRPQEIIRQSDDGDAGWKISKPMGGRMLDIDPILTVDEK